MRSFLRSFPCRSGAVLCLSLFASAISAPLLRAQAPIGPTRGNRGTAGPPPASTPAPAPAAAPAPAPPKPAAVPAAAPVPATEPVDTIVIPGPLRSFERMSGISQQVTAQDLLTMVSRKVYLEGYQQNRPTEFLLLIQRYLQQARELTTLASNGTIRVNNCDDAGALVRVLGYRLRAGCGQKSFSLETDNPTRAFLTIDSGFPLVDLEEALQEGKPFVLPYTSTTVPVLFHATDWIALRAKGRWTASNDLIDLLLDDPQIARLYYAMSTEDSATRSTLMREPGLRALIPNSGILEFYGSNLTLRDGHVIVPGGTAANAAWRELVGASPDNPGKFVNALISRDRGWLAAYYDAVARVSTEQQKHLTDPARLKHLYEAYRAAAPDTSASLGVFRRNADLLVLFSRVTWDAYGNPHVPGDLNTWKEILHDKQIAKESGITGHKSYSTGHPDQLLESIVSLSHLETDIGPLQMYLSATEIDRQRRTAGRPLLAAETVRGMADWYSQFSSWYQVFSEFPSLDDKAISRFITVADELDHTNQRVLRGNEDGSFQAALGLWQILARQGQIPDPMRNASFLKVVNDFDKVTTAPELFDASRAALSDVFTAAGASPNATQSEAVELLAGPQQSAPEAARVHADIAARIGSVLEDQRLVSLDTLFGLSDGLKGLATKKSNPDTLLALAGELREFDLPRPIFTRSEKISWAPAIYTDHHAELQIRTDLTKVITGPSTPAQLEAARGQLAPFLRDTLVGLNYAYYEPPEAQMLHHNPLFVRSHDFLGISILGSQRLWGEPQVLGVGTPAGGGAYLMGSLSDLSYALATTEQDFIAPKNIQALIVRELAPVLMVDGTVSRWWQVTPAELHATALYQRSGEELLEHAAKDDSLRTKVLNILNDQVEPRRLEAIRRELEAHDARAALNGVAPSETFYLAVEFQKQNPGASDWSDAAKQLAELQSQHPQEVTPERISRDFGVPHPTLAQTSARELLETKPFPFFGSFSSRLFAESWQSSNLYWARLADDMGYSPAALNSLVPGLTRRMISNIFATDLEDWPAVLRALRQTGDEFREGKIAGLLPPANNKTPAATMASNSIAAQ